MSVSHSQPRLRCACADDPIRLIPRMATGVLTLRRLLRLNDCPLHQLPSWYVSTHALGVRCVGRVLPSFSVTTTLLSALRS
jgi:hypothetical protein